MDRRRRGGPRAHHRHQAGRRRPDPHLSGRGAGRDPHWVPRPAPPCSPGRRRVIPGGVNSPVRAFRSVGGTPYFVARGEGAYVWGRRRQPVPRLRAVLRGVDPRPRPPQGGGSGAAGGGDGTSFGAPTEREVLLAEEICARIEGCDWSGWSTAGPRPACRRSVWRRGATGRDRIMLFAGCYHGHSDGLLAGGGSGVATLGLPTSAGVPKAAVAETIVVPYNQVPEIRRHRGLRDRGADRRQHVPGARPPPASSTGCGRRATGPAPPDLRRGHHRVPRRLRRGGGGVRGAPGPVVLREGDRWRPTPGGVRWARDVMEELAPIGRCTRPAPCRGTRWPPRRGWRCWPNSGGVLQGAGDPGRPFPRSGWRPPWVPGCRYR